MMVTWVRGLFKDIHGRINFDLADCMAPRSRARSTPLASGPASPRATSICAADFFDVERFPVILSEGRFIERVGDIDFKAQADLTLRGVTEPVVLDVRYLGQWERPFWEGEENRGTMRRIGFEAHGRVNRHDFGVSWQDDLPGGGVVVSNEISLALDVEAIALDDLERTGAIEYYR